MTDRLEQGRGAVPTGSRPRSFAKRLALAALAVLLFAGFTALGTWQLYRLQWKLALIDRVNHRVHAVAVAAPGRDRWPAITAESDEYRHVWAKGVFLYDRSTLVQAVTVLGPGFWVLTPLRRADGTVVLVNRGFISEPAGNRVRQDPRALLPDAALAASVTVTGLLRITEPGGAFLHHNNPAVNRWYSRDVRAIAAAHGLANVAPYFIDADATAETATGAATGDDPRHPVGGLTVVHFRNSHLSYALTWYTLALMVAGAEWWAIRDERRLLRRNTAAAGDDPDGESDDT